MGLGINLGNPAMQQDTENLYILQVLTWKLVLRKSPTAPDVTVHAWKFSIYKAEVGKSTGVRG